MTCSWCCFPFEPESPLQLSCFDCIRMDLEVEIENPREKSDGILDVEYHP